MLVSGLAIRTASPAQSRTLTLLVHLTLVVRLQCEPLYYHTGKCHRESSVTYTWDHLQLKKNVFNLMIKLYASWPFRRVAFQKPDSANYPEVLAFQKNIKSAKNLYGCFYNCKIVTGHEKISILKKNYSLSAPRAKRGFRLLC